MGMGPWEIYHLLRWIKLYPSRRSIVESSYAVLKVSVSDIRLFLSALVIYFLRCLLGKWNDSTVLNGFRSR